MEYVYFFRENNRPYVKIGKTTNSVEIRFSGFKTYAPLGAYIVGFIETDDCTKLERDLHIKYKELRKEGEFFKLTDEEVLSEINNHDASYAQLISIINEVMKTCLINRGVLKDFLVREFINKNKKPKEEINPLIFQFIERNKGVDITCSQMSKSLARSGYEIKPNMLGKILSTSLGYQKTSKRIGNTVKAFYNF